LFDPAGGTDDLLAITAVLAAGVCVRATLSLFKLAHGGTRTWAGSAWFGTAVLALFFLDAASAASRMTG
jgi:hypothetical protein